MSKNIKATLILSLLSIVATLGFSQSDNSDFNVILKEKAEKYKGTFQIQVLNESRELPSVPADIYDKIEEIRTEKKITYFSLSQNVRVMVLPTLTINSKDFKPVEYIIYNKE